MSSFPESSSHFKCWIFPDQKQLDGVRSETNRLAAARLKESLPSEEPISPDGEKELVSYFALQLIHVCTEKKLDYRVTSTAASFFRRFFLKRSIMEHDPRKILMTCIVLAAKVEEQGNAIPLRQLTDGLEGQFNLAEIYANELVVLDAVAFQLLVLQVRNPLHFITTEYFQSHKSGRGVADIQTLEKSVTEINAAAEKLSLDLYSTDVPFLFSPAQQALACFLRCAGGKLPGAERAAESLFRSDPHLNAKVKEKVKLIFREMVEMEESQRMTTEEIKKLAVLKILKKVDRIHRKRKSRTRSSPAASADGSVADGTKRKKRKSKAASEGSSRVSRNPNQMAAVAAPTQADSVPPASSEGTTPTNHSVPQPLEVREASQDATA